MIDIEIHPSSLDMYQDCPRRAAAKQHGDVATHLTGIQMRKLVPHVGAAVGTGVHAAVAFTLQSKIDQGDMGKEADAMERGVEALKKQAIEGLTYDDTSRRLNDAEKQVVSMAGVYRKTLGKEIEPSVVEERLEASFGQEGFFLTGRVDHIGFMPAGIRDIKTGVLQRQNLGQMGTYDILNSAHGYPGGELWQDFIKRVPTSKTQPAPESIKINREVAIASAWSKINALVRDFRQFMITADPMTFPANPNSMLCSEKFCPAWGSSFCREHKGAK